MSKLSTINYWAARLIAAAILLQTLYFKFGAHPDSIYIFSQLGMEPWGRIGTGVMELIASILLIIPSTAWAGALLGLGLMGGAIMSHLTILGIEVHNDGGTLFILALVVTACCLFTLYRNKTKIVTEIVPKLTGKS